MAFPTTGVIDTFQRADSAIASSACSDGTHTWAATASDGGAVQLNIVSNQVDPAVFGNGYIAQSFNANQEVYCTIADPPNAGGYVILNARIAAVGASWHGYFLIWTTGALGWEIRRVDAGAATSIQDNATTLVAGDKMGFELMGSKLTGYRFTGGSWVQVLTVTDATYMNNGFVGLAMDDTAGANLIDDFGGGSIPIGSSQSPAQFPARKFGPF